MSTTTDVIGPGVGRLKGAQIMVLIAALVGALVFGVAIGRATAPARSAGAVTRAPGLATAVSSGASGERHLQVMRKMNQLLASKGPPAPTLVPTGVGERVMRAMNRLSR